MIRITYQTYSPIIGNNTVTDDFKSIEDFRLFATALFHGKWSIIKIDNVLSDFDANTKRIEDCYKLRTKLA
jgi:hypothetical protein